MINKISGVKSFVKASMDLANSENSKLAEKLQKEMKMPDLSSSMEERINSYLQSKAPMSLPEAKVAETNIKPENSIFYLA